MVGVFGLIGNLVFGRAATSVQVSKTAHVLDRTLARRDGLLLESDRRLLVMAAFLEF